jgi:hypothetical protein
LAASLALALPSVAQAFDFGIQAERQGEQTLSQPEIERMRRGRAELVRTPLQWELAQTSGPTQPLDFSNFDSLLRWASEGSLPRLPVLPILTGSPGWVEGAQTSNEPPTTPDDVERWQQFVTAALDRFGQNGSFWSQNPDLQFNPITAAQVWNEPNLKTFWTDRRPNHREYAQFLKLTRQAILRSSSPDTTIVLAGMPERRNAPSPMRKYLAKLYKVPGVEKLFDVVAVHPFDEDEKGVLQGIERIRKIVDKQDSKRVPLWVTESGFASTGRKSPFTKSAKGQATALTKTFRLIRRNAGKLRVENAVWYSWRDSDTNPPQERSNDRWQTYTGLFTRLGRPKRSWDAFTRLTGGDPGSGSL